MFLKESLVKELDEVLKGIVLIKPARATIKSELENGIEAGRVNAILNGEVAINTLSESETFYLLQAIYSITENEKFNPAVLLDENTGKVDFEDDYEVVNGVKKKKSKDNIRRLYYDFDFKKKFANEYPEQTGRVIMALFRKTADHERMLDKDICNFNMSELRDIIKSFKTTTIRSLQNQISTLERYIDFAQKDENKQTDYKVNFASAFDSKEKIEGLLDKEAEDNMIFDKDEIMEMALNADNAQDGVILGLLFDGVSHKNEFEELINLTEDDVDFDDRIITLEDRTVRISYETKMLVQDALDQERKYLSINGNTVRKYKITEGSHVLRGLRGKEKVKGQIISQRILRIAEIYDYPYLKATTISYSGQLHYAKELLQEKKMKMDEVIESVLKRFGVPSNTSSQFYLRSRIEKYLNI